VAQVLLLVSREAPSLLERFSQDFAAVEAVTVIRDRRVGERRRRSDPSGAERRRSDRRQRAWADARLRSRRVLSVSSAAAFCASHGVLRVDSRSKRRRLLSPAFDAYPSLKYPKTASTTTTRPIT